MTTQRPILASFNGGEISPRMGGRVDTAIYQVALETCENFVSTVEGPIVKRPGFEYIEPASGAATWITPFKFNLVQDYIIEWSQYKLRFYSNGVRIETAPGVPYEVAVPYTGAEAPFVSAQQSYDRLYLDHPNHPPARLTRTGAASFVYDVPTFTGGPFADANIDQTIGVHASATTGAGIALTATSPIFLPGHAGALFRLEALDFAAIHAWQVGIDGINIGDLIRNEGKVYTAQTSGRTGTIAPIHTSGSAWDGSNTGTDINGKGPYGIQWQYRHDKFGIVQITATGDPANPSTTATATVLRRLPDSVVTTASWRWTHALFSTAAGWPSLVKTWLGRLIHVKQYDVAASVSGDYLNHSAYDDTGDIQPDLAFRETLATEDPVLWLAADRRLLAGTASAELAIGPVNPAAAVSSENILAEPQSFYGSVPVFPLQAGTSTFFVQRGGRKLRESQYDFSPDRYVAENKTVWARHITAGGIVQLAFQKEPEELLIGVRGDGQLVVHPHQPEQDIHGFARFRHSDGQAQILSAACISSTDGTHDELWVLVSRDGAKSIERMDVWRDDDDPVDQAFFVDSGVRGTGAEGQLHFSGLPYPPGTAIAALVAGGVVPGLVTAPDGSLTLPATAIPVSGSYSYAFGLPYTATCVTLRPELKINGETSQGKRQRLVRVVLRLLGTLGIRVGAKGGILDELIDRPGDAAMDAAIPLFSGDSGKSVGGGYDKLGQGMIVSADPLPAVIVCAMPQIEVEPPR